MEEAATPPKLNAILPTKTDPSRTIDSIKRGKINQQINPNLTTEDQRSLQLLLEQHQECFAENSKDLGSCEVLTHRIDTGEAKPIHQQPYPSSQKQVAEMLNDGVIEPSCNPWSSPVVLITKKDGTFRFCAGYRKLNNVTVKDVYPLPGRV